MIFSKLFLLSGLTSLVLMGCAKKSTEGETTEPECSEEVTENCLAPPLVIQPDENSGSGNSGGNPTTIVPNPGTVIANPGTVTPDPGLPPVVDTSPPLVDAGSDQASAIEISLNGTATDDSAFTAIWTMHDGPGQLIFSDNTSLTTSVSADIDGIYTVKLTATDSAGNNASDDLIFIWDATPPTVNAGADRIHNALVNQDASCTDTSPLTYHWTKQSGPGTLTFGSENTEDTSMFADTDGAYQIRLTCTDVAGNAAYDDMQFELISAAPTVNAGTDVVTSAQVNQDATVTGTYNPAYQWTKQSGPGTITFGTPTAEDSTISADTDGTYQVRLTVTNDGTISAYDELTFVWDQTPPTVNVGSDLSRSSPAAVDAVTSDLSTLTYSWSKQSGPGALTFGTASAEDTTISADTSGQYVVRLTATDAVGNFAFDELTLNWDAAAPVVNAGPDVETLVQVFQDGSATDFSALLYNWSQVSGPGTITFGTPTSEDTTISASKFGTYVLRLTATDAFGNAAYDEMTFKWQAFSQIWNFDAVNSYSFDDSKISLSESIAKLVANEIVAPDSEESDFVLGAYTNVLYDTDALTLNATGLTNKTGKFRSQVFDAGLPVSWNELRWTEGSDLPYLKDLPDNRASGPGFIQSVDMSDNVFLFHMNELAGSTTVYDASGEGHVATCQGIQCPKVGEQGRVGQGSYRFVASEADQFSIPDAPSLNVTGDASFTAWVKLATGPGLAGYILEKGQDDVSDSYGFLIFKSGSKYLPAFEFNDLAANTYRFFYAPTTAGLTVGKWHHLAVIVDDAADRIRFYVDGIDYTNGGITNTAQLNGTYTNNLLIAQQNYGSGHLTLDGWLDEIAIFDRALSSAEIKEFYMRGSIRLSTQVRSCLDTTCSSNPTFFGPDGTVNTTFTGAAGVGNIPGVSAKQYFQYETTFTTTDSGFSPKLHTVSLRTIDTNYPTLTSVTGPTYTSLSGFQQAVEIAHVGTVKYQLSNDGSNWFYFNGTNWSAATGFGQSNPPATINTNISTFPTQVGTGTLYFKAFFSSENNTGLIRLKQISVQGTDI